MKVKWIAIGILLGYFGKYALDWMKTWKDQKETESPEQKQDE